MDDSGAHAVSWWLYVIECEGGSLYTGVAIDVARRFEQHCNGRGASYTRMRPPLRLLGTMRVGTRSAALKLEHAFKKLSTADKRVRALAMGLPDGIVVAGDIDAQR